MRALRLFLGGTFLYAGIYKILDEGFLQPEEPTSLRAQVEAFSQISPVSAYLSIVIDNSVLFGILIILIELTIGFLTLIGRAKFLAATAGIFLSLTLWLVATWQVRPYFYASNPAYLAMWVVYALAVVPKKYSK
ncbi:MAG: TQO small subunit DoxD [Candidatus Nanopelagicales bacterium]